MNINRLETGQALRRLLAGLIEIVGAPRREFGLSETGSLETVSSSEESVANSISGATGGIISAVQVQRRPSRRADSAVLVGHSYSGMIVTEVGVVPKVTALV
jgi:hypothetical protein